MHYVCMTVCGFEMKEGRTRRASDRGRDVAGFVGVAPGKSDEDVWNKLA